MDGAIACRSFVMDDEAANLEGWARELEGMSAEQRQRFYRERGIAPHHESSLETRFESDGAVDETMGAEGEAPDSEAVGPYAVQGTLGEGGMGVVLKVWDRDLRRALALKLVKSTKRGSTIETPIAPARMARFVEEAKITGRLEHPGVVPIHSLGIDQQGRTYFTMKIVKGFTYREVIKRVERGDAEWPMARALGILLRAAEAVAFAHASGVIHRDLKPGNIMVGEFGEVYVMDWGLAKFVDEENDPAVSTASASTDERDPSVERHVQTLDGEVIGTPSFMAPEQAKGHLDEIGPAADVYSMGAVLYNLLAGTAPYQETGQKVPSSYLVSVVKEKDPKPVHELRSTIPGELIAICEKAMDRERERRYANMGEMAEDIRSYLENRVVRAYRTGAAAELRKWVTRNRGVATLLALVLVLGILGLSFHSYNESQHRLTIEGKNDELQLANQELLDNREVIEGKNRELEQANQELLDNREVIEGKNRELETVNRALSDRADEVLRLSDVKTLQDLRETARDELWPCRPEKEEALLAWLQEAEELQGHLDEHRRSLAALEEVNASESLGLTAGQIQWWRSTLRDLVKELEVFTDPDNGALSDVQRRLDIATRIVEETLEAEEDVWDYAMESIAESDLYGGLEIEPQVGLVPLREDPESGLWEFWVWESGESPDIDPQTDRWAMDEETGIILVLLPGGTFLMGGTTRPGQPNYDPETEGSQGPPHEVTLDPFFIGKYEVTQSQWQRVMGDNPSFFPNENPNPLRHPVENVSWPECREALRRLGLELPTDAQWEYACRAGTQSIWSSGSDLDSLRRVANIADRSYAATITSAISSHDWDDGYPRHAPVGMFEPNAFGLHDMHGNVFEWCGDYFSTFSVAARPGDGARDEFPQFRTPRGGAYNYPSSFARSAFRQGFQPDYQGNDLGMRASAKIQKP